MTGIERLHKLSEDLLPCRLWNILVAGTEEDWDCHEGDYGTVSDVLRAIADQIERESDVETVRSDAMEAWRWVRRRGGLATLELHEETFADLMRQRDEYRDLARGYERDATWVREHGGLSHVKDIYHDFRAVVERLGIEWSESELHGLMDALDRRLMPEGYEWPRYDPDEPVRFGDEFLDHQGNVRSVLSVKMFQEGGFELGTGQGTYDWHSAGERVKRPAPAILAADGEPLEVGQTVWNVDDGTEWCVTKVKDGKVFIAFEDFAAEECDPSLLTHQRPVLDADGVPIHEGDTVWNATTGVGPFTVREIERSDDPDEPEDIVWCGEHAANGFKVWRIAEQLTHAKPEIDTWERIEEDARLKPLGYVDRVLGWDMSKSHGQNQARSAMTHDLVRRCKALAERERGE